MVTCQISCGSGRSRRQSPGSTQRRHGSSRDQRQSGKGTKNPGMKNRSAVILISLTAALWACAGSASAADFEKEIRPILSEYCNKCHSTAKQKGDLDLERFTSSAEV